MTLLPKVLMQNRGDMESHRGGDVVQMEETANNLRSRGWDVDISNSIDVNYSKYGIVHLFNTTRINETWIQFRRARKSGCKVVVSPIWHSMEEMRKYYCWRYGVKSFPIWIYGGLREIYYALRSGYRLSLKAALSYRQCQRLVLSLSDIVLPNSDAERRMLEKELNISIKNFKIVPNGFNLMEDAIGVKSSPETARCGIVCAGRIEPRKNSVQIIKAFRILQNQPGSLKFYGKKNYSHITYLQQFERLLDPGNVEYSGCVSGKELLEIFQRTEVVILASFFETTGLVGLEALACGAKVVVLDSPYTREYFRDRAFYCDPYSVESISHALELALKAPCQPRPTWLDRFTWDNAGYQTMMAYESIL